MADLEKTYEVTLSLFKWFATTALAVNGAALIAGLSYPQFAKPFLEGPAWLFIAGATLALASGLALIKTFAKLGEVLFQAIWKNEGFEASDYDDFAPDAGAGWVGITGAILLGLSVLSFVGGCVWGGIALKDVLSERPEVER